MMDYTVTCIYGYIDSDSYCTRTGTLTARPV